MIKSDKGAVTVSGIVYEILGDLTLAIRAVKTTLEEMGFSDDEVRKLIADTGEIAFLSEGEIDKRIKENMQEMLKM